MMMRSPAMRKIRMKKRSNYNVFIDNAHSPAGCAFFLVYSSITQAPDVPETLKGEL